MSSQDNNKDDLERLRTNKQQFDTPDSDEYEPEDMGTADSDINDEIIDVEASLEQREYQDELVGHIFRGVPLKDTPIQNIETYYGAIDQAKGEIAKTGEGVYAPSDREGRSILKGICNNLRSPDFDAFNEMESKRVVDMLNSAPSAGYVFEKQANGAFELVPRAPEQASGSGAVGLVQDLPTDDPEHASAPDNGI